MNTQELITKQDQALQVLMIAHKQINPSHVINQYNNFINCTCGYHAHATSNVLVEHNSDYSVYKVIPL